MAICWLIGALVLWIVTTVALWQQGALPGALFDIQAIFLLFLGYTALAGLGFFVGTIPLGWLVVRVCTWVNGGPYAVGDRVMILTGPQKGLTTTVYALTRGQGGGLLPLVDLGPEAREKHQDIFEDYDLLRLTAGDPPLQKVSTNSD